PDAAIVEPDVRDVRLGRNPGDGARATRPRRANLAPAHIGEDGRGLRAGSRHGEKDKAHSETTHGNASRGVTCGVWPPSGHLSSRQVPLHVIPSAARDLLLEVSEKQIPRCARDDKAAL